MSHSLDVLRDYYRRTAKTYDNMHICDPEHEFALSQMLGHIRFFGIQSVLDVGSGTGRALLSIKRDNPGLRTVGIEPSADLREQGYAKGLRPNELIDGDATRMAFPDNSFDLVCSFGVLHHIATPAQAIKEMLRVARVGVFISDSNDYGRGTQGTKAIKQVSRALGLWRFIDRLWTRGKGYRITEDDGLWYSFSLFDHYDLIASRCRCVYVTNTRGSGPNAYRSASHIAMLGLLREGNPQSMAFFRRHGTDFPDLMAMGQHPGSSGS